MTNEEQIKFHLQGATDATGCTRQHVNAIKELLQPEPESLVGFHICNELGRENALLRNELTDMTLNYNAAEKHARHLEEEVVRKDDELDVATKSNAWLRERLAFKDQSLRACRAAEKVLKHDLEQASWDATKLKRELALKEQCLTRMRSRLEWIEQGLESRSVEVENRKLKRDLMAADTHIEELQADIAKQKRFAALARNDRSKTTKQVGALQVTVSKLKKNLATTEALLEVADKELTFFRKDWCSYDCAAMEELAKLRAEIEKQNKYIEILKEERRHNS